MCFSKEKSKPRKSDEGVAAAKKPVTGGIRVLKRMIPRKKKAKPRTSNIGIAAAQQPVTEGGDFVQCINICV